MQFGEVETAEAAGAILAHSVSVGTLRLRKGRRLSPSDIEALATAGVGRVVVARLGDADMGEDRAAENVAARMAGPNMRVASPFTGRVNLYAETAGLLRVDRAVVDALNGVDEAITLATLPDYARVEARTMLATVKVIPYAVPDDVVAAAEACLGQPALALHPFRARRIDLFLTATPGMKPSLLDKGEAAVRRRLDRLGMTTGEVHHLPHEVQALAHALGQSETELALILGGSATSDRADVAPAAVIATGGRIERFGMPVDPGNLLFLAQIGARRVVGLPGCARSPALNGADWILERLAADLPVTGGDIAGMGVGGLLKEIPTRPQPRDRKASSRKPWVEVLILAAGTSSRMRGRDKLLEQVGGEALLSRVVGQAVASSADRVHVMLPPASPRQASVANRGAQIVKVADPGEGMAASIRAGLAARRTDADAVIVMLADMPDITSAHIDRLIAAFSPADGREIVRATDEDGTPGHPILFGARFFESLARLEGDRGARDLLREAKEYLVEVALDAQTATTDLDTPEAWQSWREGR
ncbi:NTP transferase domain-containing protein [Pontivivens nitratireducens]|uniref:NTP transferase domain-containing protein n=1 Tax=Pontivivens nitratireducens TaxID=2758038 RepID=A0A6G7VHB6_9RHOB|nr:NTP transferase domain-containing protein [Pontibrevibacter nitratireducens]